MSAPYGPYLMRLNSNDGTKYNLLSWTMFWVGTAFFLFFVTCGSLITPVERVPHILACFVISGAALVVAVFAVFKLVTFHKIKMSRTRSSNDDERTVESDQAEASHARPLSRTTDPLPINGTTYDHSIHPSSRNPSFSPPTDSLIGLVSGESLRSRSWLYLASEASVRFRRSFSYDSSVSSVTPYAYGTFHQQPDSTATDSAIVNETSSSSLVEHPVYAVPNKGASRNDLSARSRSGLVQDPNCHLLLDCASSSSSQGDAKKGPLRSCLKNTGCFSPLNDASDASPPQAFSSKNPSWNQQRERSGLDKDSGLSNPLYDGVLYASSQQISSNKDRSKNEHGERSGFLKDSGLSNPLYDGVLYVSSPHISSSKDQSKNHQRKLSGLVKDSGHNDPLYRASYQSTLQTFSSKNQSRDQQGERSGLDKEIFQTFIIPDHSNPLDGATYAKSSKVSSNKDESQNRQGTRSGLVKDSGHTNPLYSSSRASSMQTFSRKNQSQDQQGEQSSLVKEIFHPGIIPGHSNPLDGASYAKSSIMSSSKDQSQNKQAERSSLSEDPRHCKPANGVSYARENNSYHVEQTDPSPEYYYPLTSSSSSGKTTIVESPFTWPTTCQSSEGKFNNAIDSSMKEPTKHYKKLKGKKVNPASKTHHRKLQNRHVKNLFSKSKRVRTDTKPQVYVGMCMYGLAEEFKGIGAHRFSSYSSEVSSPDEESYMGPTRV